MPNLIIPNDLHYSPANKWRQLFLRICKLSMQSANHHLSQHSRAQRRWQLENAQWQKLSVRKKGPRARVHIFLEFRRIRAWEKARRAARATCDCGGAIFSRMGPAPPMGSIQSRGPRATVSREAPVALALCRSHTRSSHGIASATAANATHPRCTPNKYFRTVNTTTFIPLPNALLESNIKQLASFLNSENGAIRRPHFN